MYLKHNIGITGENLATNFLVENNYNILDRNYRCKMGEIDMQLKRINRIILKMLLSFMFANIDFIIQLFDLM